MSITRAQIARQLYANGGRMSETAASYSSPTARAADDRFSPASDSGGGGDGNDQPINKVRSDFNYNIDPFSINPKLRYKDIASIIYLQEFLDKQAKGEDVNLEADINFRDQVGNLDIFGNLGRSGNLVGASMPFLQSGFGTLAYSPDRGLAAGLSGNLTEDLSGGVSFQDGQQNLNLNYNKGPFSAGFTSGPQGNDIMARFRMPLVKGGRIGYQMGGIGAMPMIAETPSDVEGQSSDFDLYSALGGREGMRFGENPLGIMRAAQRFAEGGEVRQAYGLGKLVRKITKPIKKIVKSDIGKAALTAAALYGGAKFLGSPTGAGFKRFLFGSPASYLDKFGIAAKPGILARLGLTKGAGSMALTGKGLAGLGILGTSALAGLSAPEEEDEDLDQISSREDKSGLREQMATYKPFRFELQSPYRLAANGGRIGYEEGGNINPADLPMSREGLPTYEDIETGEEVDYPYKNKERSSAPNIDAELFQMYLDAIGSGKIPRSTTFDQYKELMGETASMGPERTMANEGGLMNLGGNEMDLRGGGFVPLGAKEKADDVPARLSKNEFVFTADAVKAAGGGDVDRGANLMYKTMKNLESRVG
jgi:hypothetical protein